MTDGHRPTPPPAWRPRFGLGSLMLLWLVVAVTAAAGRKLMLALSAGVNARAIFVVFVLVGPIALLVVVSLLRFALEWFDHRAPPR